MTTINTTHEDEKAMIGRLADMVKKTPLFLSHQTDEEAFGDPDALDDEEPQYKRKSKGPKPMPDSADEYEVSKGDEYDVNGTIDISKMDAKKGLVFGWASVMEKGGELVIDRENDIIDDEWELEKSAYSFVSSCRVGGEDHVRTGVSHLIESMVITKEKIEALGLPEDTQIGWWTGWQITDPDVMARLEKGEFTGFSVHGRGRRTPVSKSAGDMTFDQIREAVQGALNEANPGCYCWISDLTNSWVAYVKETRGGGSDVMASGSATHKSDYSFVDGTVVLGEAKPVEVKRTVEYVTKGSAALAKFNARKG